MSKNKTYPVNYTALKSKNTFWAELIGTAAMFTLERRIFHSISLCIVILVALYCPYNLYAGLYAASITAFIVGSFFTYQYFNSRYLGRKHSSLAFGLFGVLLFGTNYFLNSGINGSTDLIWPVYLLLVLTISPYKQHFKWIIFYLLCFLAIHWVEYQFPSLIKYPFNAGKGQFLDRITAFPIPVIVIYIIITFLRNSYDKEQKATEEKTLAVEISKELISKQKDQLEKGNFEKNRLISIISHDLRTPLINIQNYFELMKQFELENEERKELEAGLLNTTNSAMEMLSNLLNWSKTQMDGSIVHLTEVNLLNVLSSTLEMERINASKKNISLQFQIPSDIIVIADIDMLKLIVRNLISNALKFTKKGGWVVVNAFLITKECKISISDNGKGISLNKQEQIFSIDTKPEYGTNKEKGVGLGLVLCKEFIEKQNGRIDFESTPGEGSTFNIFIPAITDEELN
jgi:two-component system sensor histidine kinase/response regulator